jgi:hypothetical protein
MIDKAEVDLTEQKKIRNYQLYQRDNTRKSKTGKKFTGLTYGGKAVI